MMMVDFRSDTVTQPSEAMLRAMLSAPLGDDVFGDDPTTKNLENRVASMFGKEEGLFCPSGTMTNQIAIKVHTQPGDEVVCDQLAHIYHYEGGGIAFNSGCSVKLLSGDRGRFTSAMVRDAVNPDDVHYARTALVSVENTCNKGGGSVWDFEQLCSIGNTCSELGLKYHLDGARIFNALAVSGTETVEMGRLFDSISICFSKGLGCPVGSVLVGNSAFISQARRVRKVFGGGMRQSGILAAAGLYALDYIVPRLRQDHDNALLLAEVLLDCPWVKSLLPIETNIVVAELKDSKRQGEILKMLTDQGLRAVGFGAGKIRFVTHLGIDEQSMDFAVNALKKMK